MDFDDLLLNTNILMRDFPEVLTKYQNQFRYILVDEYQDTNFAQYVIIRRLGELHGNVCVVGDDAQSIYSFRGAKIENILRFQQDFPGAKLFKLEQNYRSTQTIVNAANCVIEKSRRCSRRTSTRPSAPEGYSTATWPYSTAPTRSRARWKRRCAAATSLIRYTAACRSTSARRSRICSPTFGWS